MRRHPGVLPFDPSGLELVPVDAIFEKEFRYRLSCSAQSIRVKVNYHSRIRSDALQRLVVISECAVRVLQEVSHRRNGGAFKATRRIICVSQGHLLR
jgi:hypothetical protein